MFCVNNSHVVWDNGSRSISRIPSSKSSDRRGRTATSTGIRSYPVLSLVSFQVTSSLPGAFCHVNPNIFLPADSDSLLLSKKNIYPCRSDSSPNLLRTVSDSQYRLLPRCGTSTPSHRVQKQSGILWLVRGYGSGSFCVCFPEVTVVVNKNKPTSAWVSTVTVPSSWNCFCEIPVQWILT